MQKQRRERSAEAGSVSSISTLSSSDNEAPEPPPAPAQGKSATKKAAEKSREKHSLFDVFNTLLEGKQKSSTTLATPQTLNRRPLEEGSASEGEEEAEKERRALGDSSSSLSESEEASSGSESAAESPWSALPSPSRRRRKQDLFSPAAEPGPKAAVPPRLPAATASQRLRQLKSGEPLSPLPAGPEPSGEESAGEEALEWLPPLGEAYAWPWSLQHDHAYCFEPTAEAMAAEPPSDAAERLLALYRRREAARKRLADGGVAGGPPAKKRSMQDITNRHRDRLARGSRELAALFTPVEAKAVRREHRLPRPRRSFKAREVAAEREVLMELVVRGVDAEDVAFLQVCYQRLLDEDVTGSAWLNDTHWVGHPVTRAGARTPRLLEAHATGSARTEGVYRLTRAVKFALAMGEAGGAAAGPRGGDFPTNMVAGATAATGGGITDENASKKAKVREMRSEQRRLLAEFQVRKEGESFVSESFRMLAVVTPRLRMNN